MALDHYIPASYLGSFSLDKSRGKLRERKLFAYNFNSKTLYQTRADKLCAINNYYDGDVDKLWYYEGDIPSALDALINQKINAKQWITTLVPFVCSLLVRTPEFVGRFKRRMENLIGFSQEFSDTIRLLEFQRLLAPILAGDWKVLEASGQGQVLLSDVGFLPFVDGPSNLSGVAISLSSRHVLIIVPNRRKVLAVFDGDKWLPVLTYSKMVPGNLHSYNKSVANFAQNTLIGPTEASLKPYITRQDDFSKPNMEEARLDFISGAITIPHEFTWHRIVSYLENDQRNIKDEWVEIDFSFINKENIPFVYLPTNVPTFPSQVYVQGNAMFVELYDIDGFPNAIEITGTTFL